MTNLIHRPSGRMCQNCLYCAVRNCSYLPFADMPKIKKDKDGTIVVKCSEYRPLRSVVATSLINEGEENGERD